MGNICEIFTKNEKYNDQVYINTIPTVYPIHHNLDNSNNIPVGSPLYDDYLPSYNELYLHNNQQRPRVILLGQSPYYNDYGTSAMTGFFSGMLIKDILDGD
jgi:hypothetical protein